MVITTTANGIQVKHYQGKVVLHKIPKTLSGELEEFAKVLELLRAEDGMMAEMVAELAHVHSAAE